MEQALPIIFLMIMGLSLLIYVILDGYDLGVGMLLPLADESQKDLMIASIGPFWDANETWIVLGVGVLLIAFPAAHGVVLSALYVPVTLMLFGLILRGVAFDFRVKAGSRRKAQWNRLFFAGSLLASMAQGWMLGSYVTGLSHSLVNGLFSALIALSLPALYIMLGAAWLMLKTESELFDRAVKWARVAILPMGFSLLLLSIATPLVSTEIANKWFTLPNAIGLMPIPLSCLLLYGGLLWILGKPELLRRGYAWLVFASLVLIAIMAALGLAFSIYPDIVIGQINVWQAASATDSLMIIFFGVCLALPAIVGYTIFVYWIFHGKTSELSYE